MTTNDTDYSNKLSSLSTPPLSIYTEGVLNFPGLCTALTRFTGVYNLIFKSTIYHLC